VLRLLDLGVPTVAGECAMSEELRGIIGDFGATNRAADTVYLDAELVSLLNQLAERTQIPRPKLLREAVDDLLLKYGMVKSRTGSKPGSASASRSPEGAPTANTRRERRNSFKRSHPVSAESVANAKTESTHVGTNISRRGRAKASRQLEKVPSRRRRQVAATESNQASTAERLETERLQVLKVMSIIEACRLSCVSGLGNADPGILAYALFAARELANGVAGALGKLVNEYERRDRTARRPRTDNLGMIC
jgi:hypothetical protein